MNGYSRRERDETLQLVKDPFARNALRAAYHVRRFLVLYVCGTLAALALILLPTVANNGRVSVSAGSTGGSPYGTSSSGTGRTGSSASGALTSGTGSAGGTSSAANSGSGAALTAAGGSGGSTAGGAGTAVGSGAQTGGGSGQTGTGSSAGAAGTSSGGRVGTGVTVGGAACRPGVRQLPYSQYADPCVSKWSGNNGGATWTGVTANTITIAMRHTSDANGANSVAVEAEVEAAGGVSYTTEETYTKAMIAYWNKTIELWGRQVKLVDFNGQGNYTDEEEDTGQAAACADADAIATSVHAFGAIDFEGDYETGPFAQCAARYRLYVPEGAAYYPESFYQQLNPYVWGVAMNCTLVAQNYAEFAGKQLFDYPTEWAGDDVATPLNGLPRKIATYVPNNAGYQSCQSEGNQILEKQYGVSSSRLDQYNYALDISTFPQDAQKAIIQFSADKDTSVLLSCDPISPIFLTQDAVQQHYYPEWLLDGVALTDTDSFAQLWDQSAIDSHLFGLSQAGSTAALLNPNGEAGKFLTAAGVPINPSSVVDYYELLPMFNQLQAAGPDLTPANIAAGSAVLPPGGSDYTPEGPWDFGSYHTLIRGSRQIYWEGTETSPADGKPGTYVALAGGRFYQPGQYPAGKPGFYP